MFSVTAELIHGDYVEERIFGGSDLHAVLQFANDYYSGIGGIGEVIRIVNGDEVIYERER